MKHKGRPSGETPKALLQHLQSMASPSYLPEEDPTPQYHISDSLMEKLRCPICTYLLDRPLEISCGAVVCLDFCCKWIQCTPSLACHCCYGHPLNSLTIYPPSPLIASLVDDLLINCNRHCKKIVRAAQYRDHLAANCQGYYHQLVDSPSKMTIKDVLTKPTTSPATPVEIRAAGHLVRRIMEHNSGNQAVVKVQTQGQVIKITLILLI